VGCEVGNRLSGTRDVAGLSGHLEVVLRVEQGPQRTADYGVIVDEDDAGLAPGGLAHRARVTPRREGGTAWAECGAPRMEASDRVLTVRRMHDDFESGLDTVDQLDGATRLLFSHFYVAGEAE